MSNVDIVYDKIVRFFENKCGREGSSSDEIHDEKERDISLLRIACMGNPEKTMQGELLCHLRGEKDIIPVLEYRYHRFENVADKRKANGRSIDIMVLDKDHNPVVAIELKHHSRQQGTLKPLLENLDADREKLQSLPLPVIQIGLYTEIVSVANGACRDDFLDYRFITAYAYNGTELRLNRTKILDALEDARKKLEEWAGRFDESKLSLSGRLDRFAVGEKSVTGRVHYFIGLSRPKNRLLQSCCA